MQKFRSLKHRIIHSKRDSQKIDQIELITLNSQEHQNNHSFNFKEMMNKKLYTITEENYKIKGFIDGLEAKSIRTLDQSKMIKNSEDKITYTIVSKKLLPQNDTFKTQNQSNSPASQDCLLQNILSLMKTINSLQQKCSSSNTKTSEPIKKQIRNKLTQFKTLMGQFQNSFQSSMLDFYNEENQVQGSPNSFNSRSSEQTQPENTDRVAYQMQQRQNLKRPNEKQLQPQIQLKYRRVTDSTESFDTFSEDAQKDYYSPEKQYFLNIEQKKQEKSLNQSSIIHLFSYQKQKFLQSPLPSITQRSSEYCSPESKYPGNQLFSESLQYKKIFYLLQTTQKKKDIPISTNRHEVSEFQASNTIAQGSRKSSCHQHIDRNKSHSQLKDMINLLQTKYKRSIRKDTDTKNTFLVPVLNSKSIRQRGKR